MEKLNVNTRYIVRGRVAFGRVPEATLMRALVEEGELLPLHIADIAERFGLQSRGHTPLLLHSDQLGYVAVVPMSSDAYAGNQHLLHGPVDRAADHLLYLDGTRWLHCEYNFLLVNATGAPSHDLEHPPTWTDLASSVTSEVTVANGAG